jgi:hypothetical protein
MRERIDLFLVILSIVPQSGPMKEALYSNPHLLVEEAHQGDTIERG